MNQSQCRAVIILYLLARNSNREVQILNVIHKYEFPCQASGRLPLGDAQIRA
jgi:hypothetical protein